MGVRHCHFCFGVEDCRGLHSNKSIVCKEKLTCLSQMLKKEPYSSISAGKIGIASLLLEPGVRQSSTFQNFINSGQTITKHKQLSVR